MWRVSAIIVLSVIGAVTPVYAQPFSDTPANHWAYDTIAELAAKGLIEGYPDGTFKGDRAMTRYEMALVVARLLARIEALEVPTPPGPPQPQVTRADIDTTVRLVQEFRADLTAMSVRVATVEKELNAIKSRRDNVRISGAVRFRENLLQVANGPSINGNPLTGSNSAGNTARGNQAQMEFKLAFDAGVSPNVHFIVALETVNQFQIFNSSNFGFGGGSPGQITFGSIDSAFLDWKNAFGLPLEFWLGRFGADPPCGTTCYPVQFGPFGLLLNSGLHTWMDTSGDSGARVADGLRVAWQLPGFADLQVQGIWIRINGNTGAFSYPSGGDAYGIDASVQVFPGLRVGGYYVGNSIGNFGSATGNFQPAGTLNSLYHLYGPGGGSTNPATARCPTVPGLGITCPAAGNGAGAYAQWDAYPGVHLDLEAAQWTDTTPGGGTDSGYNAVVTADLQKLLTIGTPLTFTTGYRYYGSNFYVRYGAAEADVFGNESLYPGNAQGLTVGASWTALPPPDALRQLSDRQ